MDFKLKIKSKKLNSGKYQVHFATEGFRSDYYGYVLTEPKTSLKSVVEKIQRHLGAMSSVDRYLQPSLFSLGRRHRNSGRVLVFRRDETHMLAQTSPLYGD